MLYLIWVFLFANFQSDIDVDAGRTWLWEWIHFPLHLAMLLLIAGMVNCIAMTSWSNGLVKAYDTFHDAVVSVLDGTRLSGKEQWRIANYLGKLDLSPDFISEYNVLVNYVEKPSVSAQERNSTLLLWSYQYLGQIVQTTCSVSAADAFADSSNRPSTSPRPSRRSSASSTCSAGTTTQPTQPPRHRRQC